MTWLLQDSQSIGQQEASGAPHAQNLLTAQTACHFPTYVRLLGKGHHSSDSNKLLHLSGGSMAPMRSSWQPTVQTRTALRRHRPQTGYATDCTLNDNFLSTLLIVHLHNGSRYLPDASQLWLVLAPASTRLNCIFR
jgi:hypothetical protein